MHRIWTDEELDFGVKDQGQVHFGISLFCWRLIPSDDAVPFPYKYTIVVSNEYLVSSQFLWVHFVVSQLL